MEPTYFYFFVLPLGVLIGVLVLVVLYLAGREDKHKKEFGKLMRTYLRSRLKQEKIFKEQLDRLEALLHDKSIDLDTYARLKKLLEMNLTRRLKRLNARA